MHVRYKWAITFVISLILFSVSILICCVLPLAAHYTLLQLTPDWYPYVETTFDIMFAASTVTAILGFCLSAVSFLGTVINW